jgi:hypothetical protein
LEGLKADVQKFVVECVVCQQNKGETIKTPRLLQPLAIPSQHWEEVSMDFITGLPKSKGKSVIMVVVDRMTKYMPIFSLFLILLKQVLWQKHSWKQSKSYMEYQRLL